MFLCWGFYVSIFFFSRVQLLVEAFAVRAALKSQIISASGSLWYQRLSIWLFSCHLKCFQFFKCLVSLGCILDLLNVMRCLLLFKSYWECWYFDISRQTALLVSCHSFNLPSACCGSRAAKLFKPVQPCSALPHLGLAQWSVWGLDGRLCPVLITFGILTGNRSTELQIRGRAQEFTNNLGVCFSACVPLCVASDTWSSQDSLFGSPVRNGRFTMPCTFFSVIVSGTKWQDREEKKKQGGSPPSCWDHSSTCWRGRVPSLRVLNPYRTLLPMMSLQPPWDCLGLGVWEQREEGGKWEGNFQLWAHSCLVRIRGLLLELLSVLTAPCWVVGYIAFRPGNTRGEKNGKFASDTQIFVFFPSQPLAIYFSVLKYLPHAFVLSRFSSCISWERQGQVCLLHLTQSQRPPLFLPNLYSASPRPSGSDGGELLWWDDWGSVVTVYCAYTSVLGLPLSRDSAVFTVFAIWASWPGGTESSWNCFVKWILLYNLKVHFTFHF